MINITYNGLGEPLPWEVETVMCSQCKIKPKRDDSYFCSEECRELYYPQGIKSGHRSTFKSKEEIVTAVRLLGKEVSFRRKEEAIKVDEEWEKTKEIFKPIQTKLPQAPTSFEGVLVE